MNQLKHNITIEMVEKFQIYETYAQRFPVTHVCKITLIDGRKIKKAMDGPDIYILIQAVAKEKISFKRTKDKEQLSWKPQHLDTFNCYANFPYIGKSAPSPKELLLSLFDINVST